MLHVSNYLVLYNHKLKYLFRSVNEVICHGIPDLRPLQDGDIVNSKFIK
jgi:methionine aminopeptidase